MPAELTSSFWQQIPAITVKPSLGQSTNDP
jgi:hypothetical protein